MIGMEWMESHHVILYFHNKIYRFLDEDGITIQIKGIPRPISLRQISVIHMKKYLKKGCQLHVIHAEDVPSDMDPCVE